MSDFECEPAVLDPLAATVANFITALSMVEAVELSNLDSGGSYVDCDRLNMALQDAYAELTSLRLVLSSANYATVQANLRRWMIVIARYWLDTVRRRDDVTRDYDLLHRQIVELKASSKAGSATGAEADGFRNYHSEGKQPVWTQASLSRLNNKSYGI